MSSYLAFIITVRVFFIPFSIATTSLGEEKVTLVVFVRLFDLCLFSFVGFLLLLVSGRAAVCDCGIPWTFLVQCSRYNQEKRWVKTKPTELLSE